MLRSSHAEASGDQMRQCTWCHRTEADDILEGKVGEFEIVRSDGLFMCADCRRDTQRDTEPELEVEVTWSPV